MLLILKRLNVACSCNSKPKWWPLKAGKDKQTNSPLEPPERNSTDCILILAQ